MSMMAYIAVMAAVTYAIRTIPMTLFRKPVKSRFVKSFLRDCWRLGAEFCSAGRMQDCLRQQQDAAQQCLLQGFCSFEREKKTCLQKA